MCLALIGKYSKSSRNPFILPIRKYRTHFSIEFAYFILNSSTYPFLPKFLYGFDTQYNFEKLEKEISFKLKRNLLKLTPPPFYTSKK